MLLSICLFFRQFQPGVAYKSVFYKKACKSITSVKKNHKILNFTIFLLAGNRTAWSTCRKIYFHKITKDTRTSIFCCCSCFVLIVPESILFDFLMIRELGEKKFSIFRQIWETVKLMESILACEILKNSKKEWNYLHVFTYIDT